MAVLGGNCPSGKCASCPCGTTKNMQSASTWCSKYTGWSQSSCQCIMNAESGANANAVGQNTDSSYDVGLWQINDYNWNSCSGGKAPCDPTANLECGKSFCLFASIRLRTWYYSQESFRMGRKYLETLVHLQQMRSVQLKVNFCVNIG
jgi:hypothetical protein